LAVGSVSNTAEARSQQPGLLQDASLLEDEMKKRNIAFEPIH